MVQKSPQRSTARQKHGLSRCQGDVSRDQRLACGKFADSTQHITDDAEQLNPTQGLLWQLATTVRQPIAAPCKGEIGLSFTPENFEHEGQEAATPAGSAL